MSSTARRSASSPATKALRRFAEAKRVSIVARTAEEHLSGVRDVPAEGATT